MEKIAFPLRKNTLENSYISVNWTTRKAFQSLRFYYLIRQELLELIKRYAIA